MSVHTPNKQKHSDCYVVIFNKQHDLSTMTGEHTLNQ